MDDPNQKSRVTILVKAAPRVGKTHGETVCCAGIDPVEGWIRLFPVVFRTLEDVQKFSRWDIVSYKWRPANDGRAESRRIDHASIEVVGSVSAKHRQDLVARHVVKSLVDEHSKGHSLAFVRPIEPTFFWSRKDPEEYEADASQFLEWHKHETEGLFRESTKGLRPYEPAKYRFGYRYKTADGSREGTCQDWEIEATYLSWERKYGEAGALDALQRTFGEEYSRKGFVLAMGTHKAYPSQWLINGVVRLDHGRENQVEALLL